MPRKQRPQSKVDPQDVRKKLGEYLKEKRKLQSLSQGDLAQALGYESPQYISDWERGASAIPMKKLLHLSQILKVSSDELFAKVLELATAKLQEDMTEEFSTLMASGSKPRRG